MLCKSADVAVIFELRVNCLPRQNIADVAEPGIALDLKSSALRGLGVQISSSASCFFLRRKIGNTEFNFGGTPTLKALVRNQTRIPSQIRMLEMKLPHHLANIFSNGAICQLDSLQHIFCKCLIFITNKSIYEFDCLCRGCAFVSRKILAAKKAMLFIAIYAIMTDLKSYFAICSEKCFTSFHVQSDDFIWRIIRGFHQIFGKFDICRFHCPE